MSKIDEVRSAMVAAMKAKDKTQKRHYLLFLQPLRTKHRQTCRSYRRRRSSGYLKRDQTDKRNSGDDSC